MTKQKLIKHMHLISENNFLQTKSDFDNNEHHDRDITPQRKFNNSVPLNSILYHTTKDFRIKKQTIKPNSNNPPCLTPFQRFELRKSINKDKVKKKMIMNKLEIFKEVDFNDNSVKRLVHLSSKKNELLTSHSTVKSCFPVIRTNGFTSPGSTKSDNIRNTTSFFPTNTNLINHSNSQINVSNQCVINRYSDTQETISPIRSKLGANIEPHKIMHLSQDVNMQKYSLKFSTCGGLYSPQVGFNRKYSSFKKKSM